MIILGHSGVYVQRLPLSFQSIWTRKTRLNLSKKLLNFLKQKKMKFKAIFLIFKKIREKMQTVAFSQVYDIDFFFHSWLRNFLLNINDLHISACSISVAWSCIIWWAVKNNDYTAPFWICNASVHLCHVVWLPFTNNRSCLSRNWLHCVRNSFLYSLFCSEQWNVWPPMGSRASWLCILSFSTLLAHSRFEQP